jgi:hypothetical protein
MSLLPLTLSTSTPPPSPPTTQATSILFENDGAHAIAVMWVNFDGVEVHYATLHPGGTLHQETFLGHVWVVRERGECLGFCAAPEAPAACVVGRRTPLDDEPMVPPGPPRRS